VFVEEITKGKHEELIL